MDFVLISVILFFLLGNSSDLKAERPSGEDSPPASNHVLRATAERDLRNAFPGRAVAMERIQIPCPSATVAVFRVTGADGRKGEPRLWLNGKTLESREIPAALREAYGWNRPEGRTFLSKPVNSDEAEAIARRHAKRLYGSDRLGEPIPGYGPDGVAVVALIFPVLLSTNVPGDREGILATLAQKLPENVHAYATVVVAGNRNRPPFWHASAAAPDVLLSFDAAKALAEKGLGPSVAFDRFYHFSSDRQFLRFVKGDKDVVVCALRGRALTAGEWTYEKETGADEPLMPIERLKDRWTKSGRTEDTGGGR